MLDRDRPCAHSSICSVPADSCCVCPLQTSCTTGNIVANFTEPHPTCIPSPSAPPPVPPPDCIPREIVYSEFECGDGSNRHGYNRDGYALCSKCADGWAYSTGTCRYCDGLSPAFFYVTTLVAVVAV